MRHLGSWVGVVDWLLRKWMESETRIAGTQLRREKRGRRRGEEEERDEGESWVGARWLTIVKEESLLGIRVCALQLVTGNW